MAVRFSTVTDALTQTNSVPANTSFTLMGECCIVFDMGASFVQLIVIMPDAGLADAIVLNWNENSTYPKMTVAVGDAGVTVSRGEFQSRPEQNRPFCWYVKCSGTGTNLVEAGWRYPGQRWVKANATLGATIAAPTAIRYGQIASVYYSQKRMQNIKTWSRALSDVEILQESESYEPLIKNGLHSWCPLISASNVTDLSGLGRNMTVTNCATSEIYVPRLKKKRIPVPYEPPVGGGPYTITAEQGSYSITGQAAAVRAARKLAAAQGSYSLTGQSAGLTAGRKLAAAQGSYALTGQAAVLNLARRLPAAQGTYSLTGQAAGVAAGRKIAAAQGSYSLSGQSATLRASRQIAAAQGAYALTGQLVTVRLARKVAAGQGSYNLTGQDAALNYSGSGAKTLTAAYGSYSLAGQTAGLVAARRLSAGQGGYVLTGQAAGLAVGRNLAAAQGTYSLSGQSVTLTYTPASRVLTAAYGVYTLTGYDVALTASGVAVFEDEPRWTHLPPAAAGRIGFTIADPSGYRMGTPVARPGSRRIGRSKA